MVEDSVSDERIEQFRRDLLDWSEGNLREFPWREGDLTPYEVMIAEILLQRTRAENVVSVYDEFLDRFPDLGALADAEQPEVAELLRPLGLHNRRSSSLMEIADELNGEDFPRTEEELLELPHVGRYVANAVLCFGYGEPAAVVDSNVIRIYQRVFGIEEDRQRSQTLWNFAERVLPNQRAERFNLALLDFAAQVCTSASPRCEDCFANRYCEYYAEEREME